MALNSEAVSGEAQVIELDTNVERPIPLRDEAVAAVAAAVPEDMSAGPGPEGHVAEALSVGSGPEGQVAEELSVGSGPEGQVAEDSGATEGRAEGAESEADADPGDKRKRRRKRRRGGKPLPNPEGPPERMCGLCAQKLSRVQAREQPCKVHGCSRTWTWDRASQMRAWVLSGSDDVDYEPASPRRMCEVCREFCRTHPDREVACGRPGCDHSWTFKTGAQGGRT